ncbi:MAG: glucose-1-phosphate thymidylyltransferase [Pirellulaceae bacterium]|nr:MAG: glucose-1-phosphate thymidylyltransferase [Pirellulaceae bacterium]
MTSVVVFEDSQIDGLYPVSLARPGYAITCGAFRLIDWLAELSVRVYGVVRPHLEEIQQLDFPLCSQDWPGAPGDAVLYVNARLIPCRTAFEALRSWVADPQPGLVRTEAGIAAFCPRPTDPQLEQLEYQAMQQYLEQPWLEALPVREAHLELLRYSHELIDANQRTIQENLEYRLSRGHYREVADGVFVAERVRWEEPVVFNTRQGPIVLDEEVSVGPFSYLAGPVYVGRQSKLIEHASVKDAVSIGHTVKIGGEVEASIIEPYTNKQHYGFLGHSYLGSWINLGAGTCNSDLKNTYGLINMDYPFGRVATGRQFVGCIMGDYSKTAINTGIFTGKTIGVCSMLYGFVTTNVPSFVTYARLFGQVTEVPPEVMIATQQRMFQRRRVVQRPCDIQLIRDMYELSRQDRHVMSEVSL